MNLKSLSLREWQMKLFRSFSKFQDIFHFSYFFNQIDGLFQVFLKKHVFCLLNVYKLYLYALK